MQQTHCYAIVVVATIAVGAQRPPFAAAPMGAVGAARSGAVALKQPGFRTACRILLAVLIGFRIYGKTWLSSLSRK